MFLRFFLAILLLLTGRGYAQETYVAPPLETIRKPYKFNDNLFWGYSVGGGYSLSNYVKEQAAIKMLRPNFDVFFGKSFTEAISSKVSFGYHCQAASIGDVTISKIYDYCGDEELRKSGPIYSLHMFNLAWDGMINMNRLFGHRANNAKFKVYAVGGIGVNSVFTYSKAVKVWKDYIDIDHLFKLAPEFHVGALFSIKTDEEQDFNIQVTWHQSSKDYTGVAVYGNSRHYIELRLGITKRLINRYAAYTFENCSGNEKYYFEKSEKNMLKEYQRHLKKQFKHNSIFIKQHASQCDSILSFPHTYAYLTQYQARKLQKMAERLKGDSNIVAVIDLYPHVAACDDMNYVQSVDRCRNEIETKLTEIFGTDTIPSVRFEEHTTVNSPISPDGIWFHNAFIRYENKQ